MRWISGLFCIALLVIALGEHARAAGVGSYAEALTAEDRAEAAEARAEAAEARARKAERELRALKSRRRGPRSARRPSEVERQTDKEAARRLDELINRQYLRDAEPRR